MDQQQFVAGAGLSLLLDLDISRAYSVSDEIQPLFDGVVLKISKQFDPFSAKKTLLDISKYTVINIDAKMLNLTDRTREDTGMPACTREKVF